MKKNRLFYKLFCKFIKKKIFYTLFGNFNKTDNQPNRQMTEHSEGYLRAEGPSPCIVQLQFLIGDICGQMMPSKPT